MGFKIMATRGTSSFLKDRGITNSLVNKVSIGRPHVVDAIKNQEIQLIVNTPSGGETKRDGYEIRRAAIKFNIPYTTTIAGAMAMCKGIAALKKKNLSVKTIQEYNSVRYG
jgi:carbamoyl-phosphate synthase large subunit